MLAMTSAAAGSMYGPATSRAAAAGSRAMPSAVASASLWATCSPSSSRAPRMLMRWRTAAPGDPTDPFKCPIFYLCCPIFYLLQVSQIFPALSRICYAPLVFDDPPSQAITDHQDEIASQALTAARRIASTWLASGPGLGLAADQITDTFIQRDAIDPHYLRLAPFEKRWALLVLRLLRGVMDPTRAVDDAHARGASWRDIGYALGIAHQTAHNRFGAAARQ